MNIWQIVRLALATRRLEYLSHFSFSRSAVRAGIRCGVTFSGFGSTWIAMAILTPEDAITFASVLDAHSHRELGTFKTPAQAQAACEKYLAEWLAAPSSAEPCPCTEIPGLGRVA